MSEKPSCSQVTRLKLWLIIQIIVVILLLAILFSKFVRITVDFKQPSRIMDTFEENELLEHDEMEVPESPDLLVSIPPRVRQNLTMVIADRDEKEIDAGNTSVTRTCKGPNQRLWTKNNDLQRSSFPFCSKMLGKISKGADAELRELFSTAANWTVPEPHDQASLLEIVSSCEEFLRIADFNDEPASKEETEYPLAFVYTVYRNAAQTVRLFRTLYRPHNVYCISYDTKSDEDYLKIVLSLAKCLPNVYLNPNPEPIYYSKFPVLHSVMSCYDLLRKSPIKWTYVQMVTWNDVPLKTNLEMVKIFKALNGSQDCELAINDVPQHMAYEHPIDAPPNTFTRIRRPIPPGGLILYKGSYSNSFTRDFIDFLFTDPLSIRFYEYVNGSQFPDEFYWQTLVHNIQLNPPGGFPGQCLLFYQTNGELKPFISRFQIWHGQQKSEDMRCMGKIERWSCVFGIGDLPKLIKRMDLMAHKVYDDFQPALLYCLEEWYWKQSCVEDTGLDIGYYENLPAVKYHNLSPEEKDAYVCSL